MMKARLHEQESTYMLEMVHLKKEYELKEERLNQEVSALATSISATKKDLEVERKLRTEAELRDEQSSKELETLSGKCAELQGRLTENHAALKESRAYTESLFAIHEAKLAEIRRENSESEGKHFDVKQALERKLRTLEEKLRETQAAFQRAVAEKNKEWKGKEAELTECLKQKKILSEKLSKENEKELSQKKMELKVTNEGWESVKTELKDLMEFHSLELTNLREEQGKFRAGLQQEWDEQVAQNMAEMMEIRDEAIQLKEAHDATVADNGNIMNMLGDALRVFKEDFTVLDDKNKDFVLEMKRMHDLVEEKDKLCGGLTVRIEELELQVAKAESEKQDWLLEKSKLEEEVAAKSQTSR